MKQVGPFPHFSLMCGTGEGRRFFAGAGLAACLAAAGCSVGRSNDAARARSELIGLSKPELLQCAGVPNRTMSDGNAFFMTYDNSQTGQSGITMPIIGGGINLVGDEYCRATFKLVDDRVASVSYAGNTGNILGSLAMCGFAVATCVHEHQAAMKAANGALPKGGNAIARP